MTASTDPKEALLAVASDLRKRDPDGKITAQVLRNTIDQLYDGQRTGRYRWDQLYKTEKTHCGTLVEINLHREFAFEDGTQLDYRIAGHEVDCKYSQTMGGWMIPPEAHNHICLVVSAVDDTNPKWSMGLVYVTLELLNSGGNRDKKSTLKAAGRDSITWLFRDEPLPPNTLLQLDRKIVDSIMSLQSGQKRINALFRAALGMRVGRGVIATVAQQFDYMKRIRGNGGARSALKNEGIIILGQYQSHTAIAAALGLPLPEQGESVAAKLAPAKKNQVGAVEIDGAFWRLAVEGDKIVPAPTLPKV
jgi:hypothetical protein